MRGHLEDHNIKYRWTNAGHQLADGFTKLSVSGARSDLLLEAMQTGQIRIHYSTVSGRKEAQQQNVDALFVRTRRPTRRRNLRGLETCYPQVLSKPEEFSLADPERELNCTGELCIEGEAHDNSELDELDSWYVDPEPRHGFHPSGGVKCHDANISTQHTLTNVSHFSHHSLSSFL